MKNLICVLIFGFLHAAAEELTEADAITSSRLMFKEGRYHIPSFMVIGTQKGGTTDMYSQIVSHPLVGSKKTGRKELRYFQSGTQWSAREYQQDVINALEDDVERQAKYEAMKFLNQTEKFADDFFNPSERVFLPVATFDANPNYLFGYGMAERIKKTLPWVSKFIVTLRDPVERAHSLYRMHRRYHPEDNRSFETHLNIDLKRMQAAGLLPQSANLLDTSIGDEKVSSEARSLEASYRMPNDFYESEAVDIAWKKYFLLDGDRCTQYFCGGGMVTRGLYFLQIKEWLKYYEHDNFLFLKLEDSMTSPNGIQERFDIITDFVGLQRHTLENEDVPRAKILEVSYYNQKHKESSSQINESTRQRLQELFEPYNRQLAKLLGPEWENPW